MQMHLNQEIEIVRFNYVPQLRRILLAVVWYLFCSAPAVFADNWPQWRGLNDKDRYNSQFRFVSSPTATPDLIVVPSCKGGPILGIRPIAVGLVDSSGPNQVWRYNRTPDVCSPLVVDGLVYLCGDGILTCIDAKSGSELYKERIHSGIFRSTPVYADGKIFLPCQDGTVIVVKAGKTFEVIATNELADRINETLVVANSHIYIRGWESLYAIGN